MGEFVSPLLSYDDSSRVGNETQPGLSSTERAARLCLDSILIFLVYSSNISRATPPGAVLWQILRSIMQNLNIAEKRRENFYERRAIISPSLYRTFLRDSKAK